MVQQELVTVVSQQLIATNIFKLILQGEIVQQMDQPGQFVHVRTTSGIDPILRRPISIASIDKDKSQFTLIYRAEGKGTRLLSHYREGSQLDVIGPLGNGFPVDQVQSNETALLVGGGIGVPPLYELAKQLNSRGVKTIHVLGFETETVAFYEEEFSKYGPTLIATVDGSQGTKGFVTDILEQQQFDFQVLYTCGPIPMLKALQTKYPHKKVFVSLEERMGCGIGACFACVCHTNERINGKNYVKICSDGPVFPSGKVILE